ncbi:Vitamin B12-dependent ribonucleotide reductase [Nymphon striatum]|nr:Vitamin B12-dependent ribonucleotide reductase [Nymphon striatum]
MQAAAQKWIDSSISKTINCPEDISFDDFKEVYLEAYETGCKGCTTYRPNDRACDLSDHQRYHRGWASSAVRGVYQFQKHGAFCVDGRVDADDFGRVPAWWRCVVCG